MASPATVETTTDQRSALDGADFVVVAFQIGGYEPATVTDFELPKKYGLRQTIADTLGIGGIMRGLQDRAASLEASARTCSPSVPMRSCSNTSIPMAINTWAIAEKYPTIRQVGLCHSVQGTARRTRSRSRHSRTSKIRYRAAGINHMAFYLAFEQVMPDGSYRNLYPDLLQRVP